MDGQFNTLLNSYRDNYIQYKVTGSPSNQTAYTSAQQGIQNILNSLQTQLTAQKTQISSFYGSDIEKKLQSTQDEMKKYQRKTLATEDEIQAAKMRTDTPQPSPPLQMPMMWQYITLATLGAVSLGLMAL